MIYTISDLKRSAFRKGIKLVVLESGEKLPRSFRGRTFKRSWLCVPAGTDRRIVRAAVVRFAKVFVCSTKEKYR